jgi:sporadic carbohydrate cluster 2OG-Fe(II) oxygenase
MIRFFTPEETALSEAFLKNGYIVVAAEAPDELRHIRDYAANVAAKHLGLSPPVDAGEFLDKIHNHVNAARLNDLRLAVFDGVNAEPWFRPAYFAQARRALEILAGNELAMQLRVNLSIQLPGDDSSLLPVHSDVWNGDSAYEVVVWMPLVDCRRSKSMYLLPPVANARVQKRFTSLGRSSEELFCVIEPDLLWPDVPFGHVLIFTPTLMHGNRINREAETRWSMNCRFKSVFSPYADKRLGEFFEPITLRAATRIGAGYGLPDIKIR